MSSARDRILASIRAAGLAPAPDRAPVTPVVPPLDADVVAAFCAAARRADASVIEVGERATLPTALRATLPAGNNEIAVLDARLDTLDWAGVQFDAVDSVAQVAIAEAFAGIAETGTTVLLSADTALTRAFLADRLALVVRRASIVAFQEQVWPLLAARFGATPPRGVVLMTGPSRTADVEQTIQLGAHGPRHLSVFIVAD